MSLLPLRDRMKPLLTPSSQSLLEIIPGSAFLGDGSVAFSQNAAEKESVPTVRFFNVT